MENNGPLICQSISSMVASFKFKAPGTTMMKSLTTSLTARITRMKRTRPNRALLRKIINMNITEKTNMKKNMPPRRSTIKHNNTLNLPKSTTTPKNRPNLPRSPSILKRMSKER
jgi:hypothetical protein